MSFRLTIEPGRTEKNYWQDLWRYRELFYILSWRDIRVRYKQTAVGAAWSIIRPLLTMIIMVFAFGRMAGVENFTPNVKYPIVVFSALLPWQFFSTALSESSNSLIANTNLVSKVYFPRIIIPAASVITSMVDFLISFAILVVMIAWYRYLPPWQVVFLPLYILLAFLASFGIGLYITALNVKYRDFRYIVPFIVQFGLYLSPVGYSSLMVAKKFGPTARFWYSLNPMVGIADGFRWSIAGEPFYLPSLLMSLAVTFIFMWIGIRYFRRTEKTFADNI
jgi:lipopolysaccharide transport system permease protein